MNVAALPATKHLAVGQTSPRYRPRCFVLHNQKHIDASSDSHYIYEHFLLACITSASYAGATLPLHLTVAVLLFVPLVSVNLVVDDINFSFRDKCDVSNIQHVYTFCWRVVGTFQNCEGDTISKWSNRLQASRSVYSFGWGNNQSTLKRNCYFLAIVHANHRHTLRNGYFCMVCAKKISRCSAYFLFVTSLSHTNCVEQQK